MVWDVVRGGDLAQRATENTLRYHSLFCQVIDQHLDRLAAASTTSNNNNNNRRRRQSGLLRDTIDIFQEQRIQQQQQQQQQQLNMPQGNVDEMGGVAEEANNNNNNNNAENATLAFPPILLRRYELRILPMGRPGTLFPFTEQYIPHTNAHSKQLQQCKTGVSLRHVRAKSMGRLVTITGMVVRASDVKPHCHVATYSCDDCGAELYQVLQGQREFMPQRNCPNCAQQQRRRTRLNTLQLQTRGSKFVKFQELKLQELPSQVPMGHVPRSLTVHCKGELTRLANPGDVLTVDGVFLPQRVASGFRAMKAGLMATLYLDAQHVNVHKKSFDDDQQQNNSSLWNTSSSSNSNPGALSEQELDRLDRDIQEVATSDDPIGILASSIAPEIFGHADIKRALLLQLTGGVTRNLKDDGMKIRGDINVCLMGDPGVAKSQLLKHVASVAPRGVYTTGKGSSGVGLTAAITKDSMTGEMSLEGGALVLADRGICAIVSNHNNSVLDEFDKMDEMDRTAIHEVMEQQTVSIAKAGIVATLNARTAVLAAANPLYSRYNRNKSLSENINLPNSLLSRFDLMFLILDTPDVDKDMALARHVTFVHQNEGLDEKNKDNEDDDDENDDDDNDDDDDLLREVQSEYDEEKGVVTPRLLREYIARARRHEPTVPHDVAPYIVEAYVSLRMQDRPRRGQGTTKVGDQTAMTARQLLSILRLSQALARLRFSDFVAREDVDEAIRLTHMSKASLEDNNNNDGNTTTKRNNDVTSRVYDIIRDYATTANVSSVELRLAEAMVLRKGFTAQQLQSCLEEYEALEIIQVDQNRTQIDFVA
eukprot:scaffold4887_cov118-Cylindrotheca_fusiformis.AAC.4